MVWLYVGHILWIGTIRINIVSDNLQMKSVQGNLLIEREESHSAFYKLHVVIMVAMCRIADRWFSNFIVKTFSLSATA